MEFQAALSRLGCGTCDVALHSLAVGSCDNVRWFFRSRWPPCRVAFATPTQHGSAALHETNDLRGQRNLSYSTRRRRAGGPRRRVLPLRRLQPVVGARGGSHGAACTFCDTDFVGMDGPAEAVSRALTTSPENRTHLGGRHLRALRRLHGRRAAAATRRGVDRRRARPRLHHRGRDQRDACRAVRPRLDLRQPPRPATPSSRLADMSLKLVFPQAGLDPADLAASTSPIAGSSLWTGRRPRRTPGPRCLLPGRRPLAAVAADPQDDRHSLTKCSQPGG